MKLQEKKDRIIVIAGDPHIGTSIQKCIPKGIEVVILSAGDLLGRTIKEAASEKGIILHESNAKSLDEIIEESRSIPIKKNHRNSTRKVRASFYSSNEPKKPKHGTRNNGKRKFHY